MKMEIIREGRSFKFTPIKDNGEWLLHIDADNGSCVVLRMDDFLKVCRAFAADAENYNNELASN